MFIIASVTFSIIIFLFGFYLSIKNPELFLKTKSAFFTSLCVLFIINFSFLAGYNSAQSELIEKGLLSNLNKIVFENKLLCFIPAVLACIHQGFIIHFAKGKKEAKNSSHADYIKEKT